MIIRCNQMFMFCENRGIDFSICLCKVYAREMCVQDFWVFPLYGPALFRISTLPIGTIRDSHFTRALPGLYAGLKIDSFQRFNSYRKPNFRCRRYKKYYVIIYNIILIRKKNVQLSQVRFTKRKKNIKYASVIEFISLIMCP